jgi:hypothetical protein
VVSHEKPNFALRLIFSLPFWAWGAYIVATQRLAFRFTRKGSFPIDVNALGADAIVIGCGVLGLGFLNLALGIAGESRIRVFWVGAALLLGALAYGLVQAAGALWSLVELARSSSSAPP